MKIADTSFINYRRLSIVIFIVLIWLSGFYDFNLKAQYARKNQKGYEVFLDKHDQKNLHFGIIFGVLRNNLRLSYSDLFYSSDSIQIIQPLRVGGAVGSILINYIFNNRFLSLKFAPGVSLHFWQFNLIYNNGDNRLIDFSNSQIELPLYFRYRSVRRKNHNFYLIGGGSLNISVGEQKQFRRFSLKRQNYEISYGLGWSIYSRYTRFSPEIRFSHGLVNLQNINSESFLSQQIDRIFTHRVGLYINFGG